MKLVSNYLTDIYQTRKVHFVLLGILFLLLTIKGGGEYVYYIKGNAHKLTINYSHLILEIKSMSLQLATLAISSLIWLSLRDKIKPQPFRLGPTFYIFALCLFFIRLAVDRPEAVYKEFLAIVFNLGFYFYCWHVTFRKKSELQFSNGLMLGVVVFAILFVWSNIALKSMGQGFIGHSGRFFGITGHPNFLGVASAHSAVILMVFLVLGCFGRKLKLFTTLTLILAISLVLASASRTALLMMLLGAFLLFFFKIKSEKKSRTVPLIANGFVILLIVLTLLLSTDWKTVTANNENIDRLLNAGNTRTGAWRSMMGTFIENPIFGNGSSIGFSESSLLKICASSGFLPGLLFLVSLIIVIRCAIYIIISGSAFGMGVVGMAILSLVTISGSFFEGYLIEQGGVFPLLFIMEAWVVCVVTVKQGKGRSTMRRADLG